MTDIEWTEISWTDTSPGDVLKVKYPDGAFLVVRLVSRPENIGSADVAKLDFSHPVGIMPVDVRGATVLRAHRA